MAAVSSDKPQTGPSGCHEKLLVDCPDVSKHVASEIGVDWMQFGIAIGLKNSVLDNIRLDFQGYGVEESARRVLLKWTEMLDQEATVYRLASYLKKIDRKKLSSEILRMVGIPDKEED